MNQQHHTYSTLDKNRDSRLDVFALLQSFDVVGHTHALHSAV